MMDGQVARIGGLASTFGALYDSVLDRYSELVTLGAICFCLSENDYPIGAVITFAALIGSLMVSYVRARAEGLGLEWIHATSGTCRADMPGTVGLRNYRHKGKASGVRSDVAPDHPDGIYSHIC